MRRLMLLLRLLVRSRFGMGLRRRRVLLLSRIEGMPNREIAKQLGVTVRTVEMDLKQAVEHCAQRLKRHLPAKFALHCPQSSYF